MTEREEKLQQELNEQRQHGIVAMIKSTEETLHLKLSHNEEILNQILEQTKKTNGRVTALEKEVPSLAQELSSLRNKHENCPISNGHFITQYKEDLNKILNEIKQEREDRKVEDEKISNVVDFLRTIQKTPKWFWFMLVFIFVILLFTNIKDSAIQVIKLILN